jgi:ABC-type nitrate/sulfonate/bicarbonate transport system permease component
MQRSDRHSYLWSPIGRIIPLVVLGLIWQAAGTFRLVDPSFLPSPVRVAYAIADLLMDGKSGTIFLSRCRARR